MLKSCPECGSTEIISDLIVFSGEAIVGQHPPYVALVEPAPEKRPFIWMPNIVAGGFRAAVCGACGYTRLYIPHHSGLLEAYKKGYTGLEFKLKATVPV